MLIEIFLLYCVGHISKCCVICGNYKMSLTRCTLRATVVSLYRQRFVLVHQHCKCYMVTFQLYWWGWPQVPINKWNHSYFFNQLPTTLSDAPRPYTLAVSRKLPPSSKYLSINLCDISSFNCVGSGITYDVNVNEIIIQV